MSYLDGMDIDSLRAYRPLGVPAPNQEQGDVMRGAKVALGQTVPILKGVAGLVGATAENAFGEGGLSTGLKNWGLKGYSEDMAKLAPLQKDTDELTTAWERAKSGDVGALVDWAQFGLGYMLGQVGESAAMAILGGAAGAAAAPEVAPVAGAAGAVAGIVGKGGVKTLATNLIEKAVVKESQALMAAATKSGTELAADAAVKQATKNVARNIAATGTLVGYGTAQELGSIYPEAEGEAAKKGEKLDGGDLARVWAMGLAAGGAEGLTNKLGLDVALGKVRIPGAGRAGRALLGGTAGALTEGGTEAAQTVLERIGAGQDLTSQDAIHDYINSAGLGALGGGGLGAVGGMLHPRQQAAQDQAMRDLAGAQTADEAIAAAQRAADAQVSPLAEAQGLMTRAAQRRAGRQAQAQLAIDAEQRDRPLALPAPDAQPTAFVVDAQGNASPTWQPPKAWSPEQQDAWLQATSRANFEQFTGTHAPLGLEDTVRIMQAAQDRGLPWAPVPHPDGGGWAVVPQTWLTPEAAQAGIADVNQRIERVSAPAGPARTARIADETPAATTQPMTFATLAKAEVERRRADGTLAGQAFAREFDAGRITVPDVLATMPNPEQTSPDDRLAAAAAQAQPPVDPVTDRLTQIVRQAMAGQPQKTGIALIDSMRRRGSSASAAPAPVIAQAASTSPADQALEATTEGVNHGREEIGQRQGRRQEGLLTELAGAIPVNTTPAPIEQPRAEPAVGDVVHVVGGKYNGTVRTLLGADKNGGYRVSDTASGSIWVPGVTPRDKPAAAAPSPAAAAIDEAAHQAATSHLNDLPQPTDAQKAAGNYKVGRVRIHGMDVSVENPQGSVRKGVSPEGKAWESKLAHHYGYIRGTEAIDGDHVDTFIGPNPESQTAYVVDQTNKDGSFDEPKVMLGFNSEAEARAGYLANYDKGWTGLGAITAMPVDKLKAWVTDGVKDKPLGDISRGAMSLGDAKQAQPGADGLVADAKLGADGAKGQPAVQQGLRPTNIPLDGQKGGALDAAPLEGVSQGGVGDANGARDFLSSHAASGKAFSELDVPGKARVLKAVSTLVQNDEVFRRVVQSVPIDVMNKLTGKQFSPEDLLGNKAVLVDALAVAPARLDVRGRSVDALVRSLAGAVAEVQGEQGAARALSDAPAAAGANYGDGHGRNSFGAVEATPSNSDTQSGIQQASAQSTASPQEWWNGLSEADRAAEIARIDLRTAKGKPFNPAHTWMLLSKAAQEKVRGAFETKDTAPAAPSTMPAAAGGTPAENKGPVDAQPAQSGPAAAIEPAPTRAEAAPAPQESPAAAVPPAAAALTDPLDAKLQAAADGLKDGQQVTIQVQVGDTGKTAEMTMGAKDALADVRKRLADALQLMRCLK